MNLDMILNLSDLTGNQALSYSTQLHPLELEMVLPVWIPSPTSALLPLTLEFGWGGVEVFSLSVLQPSGSHSWLYTCNVGAHFQGEHSQLPISRLSTQRASHIRPEPGKVERLRTNSFSGSGYRERSLPRSNTSKILEMHRGSSRERLELLLYMSVLDTFNVALDTFASPLFL